ncbi:MAG TPA: alpha-glucan family phosphorylase [Desulfobacteraceae bacterium]|nr:alpha-glucan family phosphorylase [Desulfobacteraceae bacterium]HPJ67388.1 alpha-glucan family phosphorylase [Desulfobacteraceae bacterium]HPQ28950.1 alpha-glucan family phosphorylase [Desulfobacteraceae bacterium]
MKKIQLFNVIPFIPSDLALLEHLSYNLWWSWNLDAIELFRRINPALWKEMNHNPLAFLGRISPERLEFLVGDDAFMSHYEQVKEHFEAEVLLSEDGKPFDTHTASVAYFSPEYGIHESINLYSGGLGCLSGDHLKSASDMNVPMVAVGLMYKCGSIRQYLNDDGWQQEDYVETEIHLMPFRKARDARNREVRVSLMLPDGILQAVVWRFDVGRVPIFLLDANIPENPPEFRKITSQLYEADRQIRLRQELLLGIGGFKALIALGYDPKLCHMNEGHCAFASLARIAHLVKDRGMTAGAAFELVRRTNIFTTHTPVMAGNESFETGLVMPHLEALEDDLGLDPKKVISWGQIPGNTQQPEITMTILALRTSVFANGVSRLHGKVARKMWSHLWPGRPDDEIPICHVTNGVHVSSWLSQDNTALFNRYLGPEWRNSLSDNELVSRISQIPDEELWKAHELGRSRLVRMARELGEQQLSARNETRTAIAQIKSVLRHDTLTIGLARRFAAYKRSTLLLRDRERLETILNNKERPVQVVFAGKAHPADHIGKEMIKEVVHFANQPNVREKVIFLEDYDIRIARYLVQGVDVWLNTPRRPLEASGTSGMKAAVNGAINLSILDGWWDEGYSPECGWAIGHGEEYTDHDYQDRVESQALYNLLENEVIPTFYDRSAGGLSEKWIKMVKASVRKALGHFTSHRMVSQYEDLLYNPALEEHKSLCADNAKRSNDLLSQSERLHSLWDKVRIEMPKANRDVSVLHIGDKFEVRVEVVLGELRPDEVDVEVYYGPVDSENQITESHAEKMTIIEEKGKGSYIYGQEIVCHSAGRYGFSARITPFGRDWAITIPGFITWADGD